VKEAKSLLAEIDKMENEMKKKEQSDDVVIDFNQDEKLFIGDYDDSEFESDEEYIDVEENEGGAK
jgi:hypothetical protein